jgi:2-phospho-L-lactate/phosphoenolpyruvate guanylyltransferase
VSCWALVPVKARAVGKARLSGVLDTPSRSALVIAMLEHVLAVLHDCALLDGVAVMTPDRGTLPADVLWLGDAGGDVNQSLRAALGMLSARGVHRAAVVSADLPLLAADEVAALIRASEAAGVALAPDRHGAGTNAMALALPSNFCPHFGRCSLALHRAEAARLGVTAATVRLPGLELDVDEPEDLALLARRDTGRYGLTP